MVRETVQLLRPSYTCVFKEIKLVLMYIDVMELFEFLVDEQSPKAISQPLTRLWMFCNAAVQSSRWWSSEGRWGNKELCSLATPGKGTVMKVPLPLW